MGEVKATSGIQVIDRSVLIVEAVSSGPLTLNELCEATNLPRATAHRLATALEQHRVLARTDDGAWTIGPWLTSFSGPDRTRLLDAAHPVMLDLVDTTGESVQLYQLTGTTRTCVAAVEPPSGLRNTVPVGSQLPLTQGSAAKVFMAYAPHAVRERLLSDKAAFSSNELAAVLDTGLAESVAEREVGLASLSAPVVDKSGELVAVLSISGPAPRLEPSPAKVWGEKLVASADELGRKLTIPMGW